MVDAAKAAVDKATLDLGHASTSPLGGLVGTGQVNLVGGSDCAMRVWPRPDRIAKLGITVPRAACGAGHRVLGVRR